jgi:hypothetical protein
MQVALLGALVVLGLASAAPAAWSSSSGTDAKPILKITAGIRVALGTGESLTPVHLTLTPSVVNVGTVVIVIRNYDPIVAHQLGINGHYSNWMGPNGGTAVLKVTFNKPGRYVAGTFGGQPPDGDETGGTTYLKVVK